MEMNTEDFEILLKIVEKTESILGKIKKLINKSNTIAVIGHLNPDGDCIGSQLALGNALALMGKKVMVINQGPFEGGYAKYFEKLFIGDTDEKIDLYIIVDSASDVRVGYDLNKIDLNKTIVIDHHISNTKFGKTNWIEGTYLSTCEMIFLLLFYLKIDFTKDISQYLLNGVLSDNGYFQHIGKDKFFSLYVGYLLIKYGGDPKFSHNLMFGNNTLQTERVFALVLNRLEEFSGGKIVMSYIEKNEMGDFHQGHIFREMMSIRGVEIAVFFKIDSEKELVNISFRSTDNIDVSSIANKLGGGGHRVAAGAHVKGDYKDTKAKTLKLLEESLNLIEYDQKNL